MNITTVCVLMGLSLQLSHGPTFYVLRQDHSKLLLCSYHVERKNQLVMDNQAEIADVLKESKHTSLVDHQISSACLSPKGTWLAVFTHSQGIEDNTRALFIVEMRSHRIAYRMAESGNWTDGCSRWKTDDCLLFTREKATHSAFDRTESAYKVYSVTGPQWYRTERMENNPSPSERVTDILLAPSERERRRGAERLLEYLGYDTPLRRDSSHLDLLDYLDGKQGAIGADGAEVCSVVFKRPAQWSLDEASHYKNTFVWLRKEAGPSKTGWSTRAVPIELGKDGYPDGVWFWNRWLIIHLQDNKAQSSIVFFDREGSSRFGSLEGDVFIPPP